MKLQALICALGLIAGCAEEVPTRARSGSGSGVSSADNVSGQTSQSDDVTMSDQELTPEAKEETKRVFEEYEEFFDEDIFKQDKTETDVAGECKVGKNMDFFLAISYIAIDQLLVNQDVRYQGLLPVIEYLIDQSTEIQTGQNYETIASELAFIVDYEFPGLNSSQIIVVEKGVLGALKALNFSCEEEKLQLDDVFDFVVAVLDSLPQDFQDQLGGLDLNYLKVLIKGLS